MIQYYYGDGKGKTSAALGAALRAAGAGMSVFCVFFLKDNSSSERRALSFAQVYPSPERVPFSFQMSQTERASYSRWAQAACQAVLQSSADMIVLDEFVDAQELGFVAPETMRRILQKPNCELVITGHRAHCEIVQAADYVTCFQKEKHPFDRGIPARKGIEY